jgi:hypothetical protein
MNKALQFCLIVCAVVALSLPAEAGPRRTGPQKCREISGSGSFIVPGVAKDIATNNLQQKIENLKQKAPGKVTVMGKAKSTCSGFDCKESHTVCMKPQSAGGYDYCCGPDSDECCD